MDGHSREVLVRSVLVRSVLGLTISPFARAGKHMSQYDDAGFDVGDDLDQAVGLQHAELVADLQDKPFFQECLISGPFGTVDNPVKVESVLGYRIVGCTGAEPQPRPTAHRICNSGCPDTPLAALAVGIEYAECVCWGAAGREGDGDRSCGRGR